MIKAKRGRPVGKGTVDPTDYSVGSVMRRGRISLGLGLADVAWHLGSSVQFISNIEHGRAPMPMEMVRDAAAYLELSVTELAALALRSTSVHKEFMKLVA